jgi:conjugal transfer ATP-binding protein TraC
MFRKRKPNHTPTKRPGKRQPDYLDAKPEGIDFAAPSMIKEVLPNDISADGVRISDYVVSVGGTVIPEKFYRSFFAEITAGNTWGGMMDDLIMGDFGEGDMDLAIHIRPANNERELDELGRRIAGLLSDLAIEKNVTKIDAMRDEISDLKERQKRIRMNIERSYRVAIQVVASGIDWKKFKKFTNGLVNRFGGKSIILRAADGNQLEALKNILPLSEQTKVNKEHFMSMETSNVADLFPFGQGGISHRTGIIIGKDVLGRPVWLDGWHPSLTNQHMVIMGRSGAGKTYSIMTIIHRSVHLGIHHAIVDWKGEYRDFVVSLGCPFIELSDNSKDRINPYDVDITEEMDGTRFVDIEEATNAVQALVFKMISTYDRKVLTGEVKVFIGNAIRKQYQEVGISRDLKSLYRGSSNQNEEGETRFLSGGQLKSMPELNGLYEIMAKSRMESVQKAGELLKPFTKHGNAPSYAIFDGQSTVKIANTPLFSFAINRLDKEIMRPIGLFAVTRWLSEKFAKKNPELRKRIVIEECHNIFNDPDVGGVWAEGSYREGRSTNTSVCAVTQGLEVFTRSDAGIAAIKNSPIKIIGVQESIDIASVQGKLNLSEGEADFLINQATKGWVVCKVDNESTIVNIDASEHEHMLFTTDPNDSAFRKRKEYIKHSILKREKGRNEVEATDES